MYKTASNGSRMKPRAQFPVVTLKSCSKFQNINFQTIGTQTPADNSCSVHSQQITELLTEVAITLGHKAKLENEISTMKEEISDVQRKFDEIRFKLEQEVDKLKRENFDKEMELSKLKISRLEEQKALINQISDLKSEIQNLNQENESVRQELAIQKNRFEMKININQEDLKKEADKNIQLQLKATKYKNKFKNLVNYMQQSFQDLKDKQLKEIQTQTENKISTGNEPDMENLVLSELFFKPSPLPTEVEDLFFNLHT